MLAVPLVGAQPQAYHEGEMGVLERHGRPAQARDPAAKHVELLAGLDFGRVGQKRVLDLRHGSIVAGGGAGRSPLRGSEPGYGLAVRDACSKALWIEVWRFVNSFVRFRLLEVCSFV